MFFLNILKTNNKWLQNVTVLCTGNRRNAIIQSIREQKERQKKYKIYLDRKRRELNEVAEMQRSIISENLITLNLNITLKKCNIFLFSLYVLFFVV